MNGHELIRHANDPSSLNKGRGHFRTQGQKHNHRLSPLPQLTMTSSEGPKKTMKAASKRRKKEPTLASYIYKVHKQIHPSLGISSKAIGQINGILDNVIAHMISTSAGSARVGKKSTLSARHVQCAVPLTMGFELSKHAISEGTKAVAKFATT